MNIEKFKPWNWFKHEGASSGRIPVTNSEAYSKPHYGTNSVSDTQQSGFNSLLQLHQQMDRLFDDVWQSFALPGMTRQTSPLSLIGGNLMDPHVSDSMRARLNVSGSDDEYEISVELPGLSEEDIQIELNDNTLVVRGQKQEESENKDKHFYRIERSVGTFMRTLSLPDDVDTEAISASMKNGLLRIHVPRNGQSQETVKRIPIS